MYHAAMTFLEKLKFTKGRLLCNAIKILLIQEHPRRTLEKIFALTYHRQHRKLSSQWWWVNYIKFVHIYNSNIQPPRFLVSTLNILAWNISKNAIFKIYVVHRLYLQNFSCFWRRCSFCCERVIIDVQLETFTELMNSFDDGVKFRPGARNLFFRTSYHW